MTNQTTEVPSQERRRCTDMPHALSQFTPGPWTSEYDDNGFYCVTADGMPSPYIAATGGEGETNQANAALIAAAPDLLAALEYMADLFKDACGDTGTETGWKSDEQLDVWQRAQAAIAKAEGKS